MTKKYVKLNILWNINLKKEGVANIWKTILCFSNINTHNVNSFQVKQCYSKCRKGVRNDQRNARYMIGKRNMDKSSLNQYSSLYHSILLLQTIFCFRYVHTYGKSKNSWQNIAFCSLNLSPLFKDIPNCIQSQLLQCSLSFQPI